MQLAITVWDGQMATVADFARRLLLVDPASGGRRTCDAPGPDAAAWCARLAAERVGTLVCGAITRHLARQLEAAGITVIDGCAGTVEAVIADWLAGTIDQRRRPLAGCRGWRGGPAAASSRTRPQESAMPIAISSAGPGLDDALDLRFGRCRHILVCAEGAEPVHHANPAQGAEHGAGIRTAEFVAGLGVKTVLTGAVGPKAMEVLRAAGIRAFASGPGSVREALARLRAGALPEAGT